MTNDKIFKLVTIINSLIFILICWTIYNIESGKKVFTYLCLFLVTLFISISFILFLNIKDSQWYYFKNKTPRLNFPVLTEVIDSSNKKSFLICILISIKNQMIWVCQNEPGNFYQLPTEIEIIKWKYFLKQEPIYCDICGKKTIKYKSILTENNYCLKCIQKIESNKSIKQ